MGDNLKLYKGELSPSTLSFTAQHYSVYALAPIYTMVQKNMADFTYKRILILPKLQNILDKLDNSPVAVTVTGLLHDGVHCERLM